MNSKQINLILFLSINHENEYLKIDFYTISLPLFAPEI